MWDGAKATRRLSPVNAASSIPTAGLCEKENKDYLGGDLESIIGVIDSKTCHQLCLEREDCKKASYSAAERICKIKWGGPLVDRPGFSAIPRTCSDPCDNHLCLQIRSSDINIKQPAKGLAERFLGKPSEWIPKGEAVIDFSIPSTWQRISLILLTDDAKQSNCFISDWVQSEYNCWNERSKYLPLHLRAQIIGVASGAEFKGWSKISWEKQRTDLSQQDGHFELLNEDVRIVESGIPHREHGIFTLPIADRAFPSAWPSDLTSPLNFYDGRYYARVQAISTPIAMSFRVMFCLTGSDYPLSESCTHPMVVPPYDV